MSNADSAVHLALTRGAVHELEKSAYFIIPRIALTWDSSISHLLDPLGQIGATVGKEKLSAAELELTPTAQVAMDITVQQDDYRPSSILISLSHNSTVNKTGDSGYWRTVLQT